MTEYLALFLSTWLLTLVTAASDPWVQTKGETLNISPQSPIAATSHTTNCEDFVQCLIQYPQRPNGNDPDWIEVGIRVDPSKRPSPGDRYCPSGRCIILDPAYLCNGYSKHCIPVENLRRPLLPCDPRNRFCKPGGFQINVDEYCHPFDTTCGQGGVYVKPKPCQISKICPIGWYIPPWIDFNEIDGTFNVTDPIDDIYHQTPDLDLDAPGVLIRPDLVCPRFIPECNSGGWLIIRPDEDACTLRQPGCINLGSITRPLTPNLPNHLCPSGHCIVIRPKPCHPNDLECRGIKVDPIPCRIGTRDCNEGMILPRPIQQCKPGAPGCHPHGFCVMPPSQLRPDIKPPPKQPSMLVPDIQGDIKCSYVTINHLRPKLPDTPNLPIDNEDDNQFIIDDSDPGFTHNLSGQEAPVPQDPPQVAVDPPGLPPPLQPNEIPQPPTKPPQPPQPVPEIPTGGSASPPATSASKFPCSSSDANPCLGTVIRPWLAGGLYWDWSGPHAKPNMPKRGLISEKYFTEPTILEVVDSWFNNAHYTVYIDGEPAGESTEKELQNNKVFCAGGPDCVSKGFSHVFVLIPTGQHKVELAMTRGHVNGDPDKPFIYAFTQYLSRLLRPCDANHCPS